MNQLKTKPYQSNQRKISLSEAFAFLAIVISSATLYTNYTNLRYNIRSAESSERGAAASEEIAEQLKKINGNKLLEKINNEADNQNTKQSNKLKFN